MFSGSVRRAESKDHKAIEEIFNLYWSGDFRHLLSERLQTEDPDFTWFVAEEDGEIVGVAASRQAPKRMRQYTKTDSVVEFYVSAAKYQGKGIGTALRNARIENAREEGYQEVVFFSGETHQDSWAFHDNSGFRRAGEAVSPNGEKGQIWVTDLR